jgi:Xaa-Pro aminopeptidase
MKALKRFVIIALCCFSESSLEAQNLAQSAYDQDHLPKEFHRSRREALRAAMPSNSIAFIFSNPIRNYGLDNDYRYHQNPDFYYLTGFTEPHSVLVIFSGKEILDGIESNEIIFVPARDVEKEQWNGRRLGLEGARDLLGIQTVRLAASFDSLNLNFKKYDKILYTLPQGIVNDMTEKDDLSDLVDSFKKKSGYPPEKGDARQLQSILTGLREIKQPEELTLMRKAIDVSCDGHMEMMRAAKPGMTEYQVQATGELVFMKGGAENPGYPSICGSGENGTILHYQTNRKRFFDGDLILLDMGAEYHGYTADITRTFPVSGRFSAEQKIIYELVLRAQEAGFQTCKPGNSFQDPHLAAAEVINNGLQELEIIRSGQDYKKYFSHYTSHYLGLDVHDAGTYGKLKSGNVITVEPGIYIPEGSPCDPRWWNIGIRIEDDILITSTGFENLSVKVPRSVAEIEKMMKQSPLFVK